ncbi:hemoglobin subunit beta-2-like [Pelodytes ibericus]
MVHWTAEEKAAITSVWKNVDVKQVGGDAIARLLVVYPWTQRYFSSFGDLSSVTAIAGNSKVKEHGEKVLTAVGNVIQHLGDVKATLHDLSRTHAFKLHVDPQNFKLLGQVLVVVLAQRFADDFTPQVQAAWEKFIAVLVAGLSQGYH